jgi:hypothetical protein
MGGVGDIPRVRCMKRSGLFFQKMTGQYFIAMQTRLFVRLQIKKIGAVNMSLSKYQTGIYTITLFDGYGRKTEEEMIETGLINAQEYGKARISNKDADSFTISRCLFNSKDNEVGDGR